MTTTALSLTSITVPEGRQRSEFRAADIEELADDIEESVLIHAPVVHAAAEGTYNLVAGERRLRAIREIFDRGSSFEYAGELYADTVPVHVLEGDWSDYDLARIELHENVMRKEISWQDRARAIAKLHRLEKERGSEAPVKSTAAAVAGLPPDEAEESRSREWEVSQSVILDRFLDDPDVAKAENPRKAMKIAESKAKQRQYEERRRIREAGDEATIGELASRHTVIEGDTHEEVEHLESHAFRCILTDPPYGLDISKSHWGQGSVEYSDSEEEAALHYTMLSIEGKRLLHEEGGFIFAFCDPRMFGWLVEQFEAQKWDVWPHPIIWDRTPKGLLPIPEFGPRRCYEAILMARYGAPEVVWQGRSDVIRVTHNPEHNRPGEKPVELFQELLYRVVRPGDRVLDPFAGTGPIIEAAHNLSCEATAVDSDKYAGEVMREKLEVFK